MSFPLSFSGRYNEQFYENSVSTSAGLSALSLLWPPPSMKGLNVRGWLQPPGTTSISGGQEKMVTTPVHNPMPMILKFLQNDSFCRKRAVSWVYVCLGIYSPGTQGDASQPKPPSDRSEYFRPGPGASLLRRTAFWSEVIFPLVEGWVAATIWWFCRLYPSVRVTLSSLSTRLNSFSHPFVHSYKLEARRCWNGRKLRGGGQCKQKITYKSIKEAQDGLPCLYSCWNLLRLCPQTQTRQFSDYKSHLTLLSYLKISRNNQSCFIVYF